MCCGEVIFRFKKGVGLYRILMWLSGLFENWAYRFVPRDPDRPLFFDPDAAYYDRPNLMNDSGVSRGTNPLERL